MHLQVNGFVFTSHITQTNTQTSIQNKQTFLHIKNFTLMSLFLFHLFVSIILMSKTRLWRICSFTEESRHAILVKEKYLYHKTRHTSLKVAAKYFFKFHIFFLRVSAGSILWCFKYP